MSEKNHVWESGEDVQALDNALADSKLPQRTRRALIERASASLLALGGTGALLAACGSSSKKTTTTSASAPSGGAADIQKIIDTAITAEALAVTYLTGLVLNAKAIGIPANLVPVLKAANAAELDHYKTLGSLGAKPLTTKFWAPTSFFQKDNVFPTIEYAETQFVNAYLIAISTFANAGKDSLARYAGEILGTEAEHRALARFAQGKLPNNVSFEEYNVHSIGGIVDALEKTGIGFGQQSKHPGRFYHFSTPPSNALIHIASDRVA